MKRIDLLLLLGLLILVGCDSKANQEADVIEHYQYTITITDSNWSEYESSELDADSMEYLQLYAINVNFPKMISALYPDIQLIRTPEDVQQPGVFSIKEQNAAYTYEELMELPGDQLVKVFVENGLEIDDEFKEVFTEEEFQDYFKGGFDFLRKGVTLRGHTMYFDLAGKTEVIYKKITGEE